MKKHTVLVLYDGLEQEEYSYEQQENEQVCERFALVENDRKLVSAVVEVRRGGAWTTLKGVGEEDRPHKGDRLVSFDMPAGDVRITAKYAVDETRVRMRIDLQSIRNVMSEVPSYFYSAQDDINGDSFSLEEGTFFYDDREEMTFVLRLRIDADVRLRAGDSEYAPVEKRKRLIGDVAVYEYTFGFVDEYDKKYASARPVVLRAPETTVSFYIVR